MRQLYAYDANESTPVDDWLKTGWARDSQTVRGFSVLYHLFARKQSILCSALRHKSYLTLYFTLPRTAYPSHLRIIGWAGQQKKKKKKRTVYLIG